MDKVIGVLFYINKNVNHYWSTTQQNCLLYTIQKVTVSLKVV